jgi:hypothetical protein
LKNRLTLEMYLVILTCSMQEIHNNGHIETQVNAPNSTINLTNKKSRWQSRFEKLKNEVESDIRFEQFIDDFTYYNTLLDGKSMPEKLKDGGFSDTEILEAKRQKEKYAKKIVSRQLYETEQRIDVDLFASIKLNFDTYLKDLVEAKGDKREIKILLTEKVIVPILELLNEEGKDDFFLNYTAEDIKGMIFFLTGKCHINWTKYDNI